MLTVKRIGLIGEEGIYEAERVSYFPSFPYPKEQVDSGDFEYGFAEHSEFVASAPTLVVYWKGKGTIYQCGKFYVMNEAGKTVDAHELPYPPKGKTLKGDASLTATLQDVRDMIVGNKT